MFWLFLWGKSREHFVFTLLFSLQDVMIWQSKPEMIQFVHRGDEKPENIHSDGDEIS